MAITSRDPEIGKKYNRVRNQVKSHVNKPEKKYEKDLVQRAKENPKVIWKYIKSKSKTRDGISDLHMNPADTLANDLFPFLNMALTNAVFQSDGSFPISSDCLNIWYSGFVMELDISGNMASYMSVPLHYNYWKYWINGLKL
jgi:hypothetical protein